MLLEHDAAIAFFISPLDHDEVVMSDLRSGLVLNALSGLSAEVRGGWEGGWLHSEVFGKSPSQVLDEALLAALEDATGAFTGETPRGGGRRQADGAGADRGLSPEQVNLALRRRAMQAQAEGMRSLLGKAQERRCGPRCSEEFMRIQVWLELARLHVEGLPPDLQPAVAAAGGKEAGAFRRAASTSFTAGAGAGGGLPRGSISASPQQQLWDDQRVITELGKPEADLQAESRQMSLDALRTQNRSIEAYLMRLVRQRDQLKHMARLAEECDSYLILGLEGPSATDDEVKKAYRALARKEHPDKAGVANKERFQEIQQAYSAVLRRRRNGGPDSAADPAASPTLSRQGRAAAEQEEAGAVTREAAARADLAREAADALAALAHAGLQLRARASEVRGLPKRAALRELQSLTRRSVAQLRQGSQQLRGIRDYSRVVASCAEAALAEYGEWADTAMAGAGLKERAEIMEGVGQSCISTAEHLEKMGDSDDMTVQRMERASSEVDVVSGARILSENLARTATVLRCAADEAIGAATTALELSCSLAVLDRQRRIERAEKAAEQREQRACESPRSPQASPSDSPQAGPRRDRRGSQASEGGSRPSTGSGSRKDQGDRPPKAPAKVSESPRCSTAGSSREEARGRQANLRVRHLQCLASLNEEVLALQHRLRTLLGRSEGLLLPAVAPKQKGGVFDLVAQLLQAALAEAAKLAADGQLPSKQVLERSFAFALAVEHSRDIALPAEVKTQALRLAALVDVDLLCQIIDGPFKRRLMSLEKCRPAALRDRERIQQLHLEFSSGGQEPQPQRPLPPRRSSSNGATTSRGGGGGNGGSPSAIGQEAWCDAVQSLCARVVAGLREPLAESPAGGHHRAGMPATVVSAY